jgi:Flp pilus assembly protein TadD
MRRETTSLRAAAVAAAAFALGLTVAGIARAAGDNDSNTKTCAQGEVYDSRSGKCIARQAGVLPDRELADYAYALAKAGRYGEAIEVLDLLKNPNTAVALNYRGYATRKMGRLDEGIGYYLRSVALDPHYAQVREYLGEAYVIKGDLARAKEQLVVIKGICGTDCEEYEDLEKAIAGKRNEG